MTKVVHHRKAHYDIFIGRTQEKFHFGNPFSSKESNLAHCRVANRSEAIAAFEAWLTGEGYHDVEPERREWILNQIPLMKGKTLGCWCSPLPCHGDVYVKLANISDLLEF